MQGDDEGTSSPREDVEHLGPVRPAEDPVLVLNHGHIEAIEGVDGPLADESRSPLRWVKVTSAGVESMKSSVTLTTPSSSSEPLLVSEGVAQRLGEGGQPTRGRRVGGQKSDRGEPDSSDMNPPLGKHFGVTPPVVAWQSLNRRRCEFM